MYAKGVAKRHPLSWFYSLGTSVSRRISGLKQKSPHGDFCEREFEGFTSTSVFVQQIHCLLLHFILDFLHENEYNIFRQYNYHSRCCYSYRRLKCQH